MPHDNDQETVMECQPEEPEPFAGTIDQLGTVMDFRRGVFEKRPKSKNLQKHPDHNLPKCCGAIKLILLHPVKGFLLAAGCWNSEGNRRLGPADNPVDKTTEKYCKGQIGEHHPE